MTAEPLRPGTRVQWTSRHRYRFTGTVTAHHADRDDYEIATPSGGTALIPRAMIETDDHDDEEAAADG